MKRLVVLLLLIQSIVVFGQAQEKTTINLAEKTLIGVLNNSNLEWKCDTSALITYIDNNLPGSNNFQVRLLNFEIDGKSEYYLEFFNAVNNKKIVKWLKNEKGHLFVADDLSKKYKHLSQFISCEGENECYPRLKIDKGELYWSCREISGCVNDEYAKQHPCTTSKSRISK